MEELEGEKGNDTSTVFVFSSDNFPFVQESFRFFQKFLAHFIGIYLRAFYGFTAIVNGIEKLYFLTFIANGL